ncbi:MAG: AbrB/MazE/SpoVT family DNA-binding domain-containing protein [Euryarchaeota archaeon]|nr:AbrB/MazE/SpoVT family DNA-binding domain-containing protein [Euryarchaeota archaeon]
MPKIQITKISSRGQVVIPKTLREGLEKGTPFVIMRKGDTIFLKKIKVPAIEEFEKLVGKGVAIAKEEGLEEEDIERIVHKHRKR